MEMGGVLLEGEDAAEDGTGPDVVLGFAPSCWMSESAVEWGAVCLPERLTAS